MLQGNHLDPVGLELARLERGLAGRARATVLQVRRCAALGIRSRDRLDSPQHSPESARSREPLLAVAMRSDAWRFARAVIGSEEREHEAFIAIAGDVELCAPAGDCTIPLPAWAGGATRGRLPDAPV